MIGKRSRKRIWLTGGAVACITTGVLLALWFVRPPFSREEVRTAVITTMQREAPKSFLVTGSLELTANISASSTKYLLPSLLNLSLGTTESQLRCPGRVTYGFDVRELTKEEIDVSDDGLVSVLIPALEIYSIEPFLESLELETTVGWARLYRDSGIDQERKVLGSLREVLRDQARIHLLTSDQPGIHTARALDMMLTAPLQAAGVETPRVQVTLGDGLTYLSEQDTD